MFKALPWTAMLLVHGFGHHGKVKLLVVCDSANASRLLTLAKQTLCESERVGEVRSALRGSWEVELML